MLGSNPPQVVMEGYFKRIWGALGIDKIAQRVRMFDRKPIAVKPWSQEVECNKESVEKIPVWARLNSLDIKYWGKNALTKVVGLIGKPLKADSATTKKER